MKTVMLLGIIFNIMIGNSINNSVQTININSNPIASTTYSVKLISLDSLRQFFFQFIWTNETNLDIEYFICEFYPPVSSQDILDEM